MSAPVTRHPILDSRERRLLEAAKADFDKSSSLKPGSPAKNGFIKCVQKLVMVLAESLLENPQTSVKYDLAKSEVRARLLQEVFQKICVHLCASDEDIPLSERVGGVGTIEFMKFWEDFVQPLMKCFGKSIERVHLMSIVCTSIGNNGGVERFKYCTGESVKTLAADVKSEYLKFEQKFRGFLGPDGKPSSGKTWDDILDEFRKCLFLESESENQQKKTESAQKRAKAAQNDAGNKPDSQEHEEQEASPSVEPLWMDPFAITGEENFDTTVPDDWL